MTHSNSLPSNSTWELTIGWSGTVHNCCITVTEILHAREATCLQKEPEHQRNYPNPSYGEAIPTTYQPPQNYGAPPPGMGPYDGYHGATPPNMQPYRDQQQVCFLKEQAQVAP